MALEKVVETDLIEIKGEYSIQVRQATRVLDDGKQIGGVSYHRHVVHPNSSLDNEDAKVAKIAEALFDDDCKQAWADLHAPSEPEEPEEEESEE